MTTVGVLGAGSWGTALAVHAAAVGCDVRLWARCPELVRRMREERRNAAYLRQRELPAAIRPTAEMEELADAELVFAVVPSHGYRDVVRRYLGAGRGRPSVLVSATKGIETESLSRMSEISREEAAAADRPLRFAVLSGPTFAAELVAGVPSAAVVASDDEDLAGRLGELLSNPVLRLYSSSDVVGVELGGATKNVIAIGAGIVSGLGLGHNTLAALITRGLHEITRLGVSCGGRPRTFSGLAGLGDLVLTCTGELSRNRQTGVALAEGKTMEQIQAGTSMVAEGIRNAVAVTRLARRVGVEMPITEQMVAVMYEAKPPREAVEELMTRELKSEAEL